MSNAFVIESASLTAGLAVREDQGFRFYASDAAFRPLDDRHFHGLRTLRAAVDRLALAVQGDARQPRRFHHDR